MELERSGRKENSSRTSRRRLQATLGYPVELSSETRERLLKRFRCRGLAGVFATTTKICTDGGSRRAHAQTLLRSPPRTSYSLRLNDATSAPHMPVTVEYRQNASAPSIFRAGCFGRRVLRVPETESSPTETRTVRDNGSDNRQRRTDYRTYGSSTAATSPCVEPDAPKRVRVSRSYRPTAGRRPPRSYGHGDRRAPERGLGRHRTGRDVLLREKCTPSTDAGDTRRARHRALDGVYHPLRAALSSNPTLRRVPLAAALRRYGPGTLYGKTAPFKTNLDRSRDDEKAEPPEHHMSRGRYNRGIRCWALSCSLAATKEILVSFFSSAY
ncbi:hypothetical protein JYU34_022752 [Plutella xylostella]|uniref:Uncharacterized protein n=1 Tax=Plutella xylostella TaxID=51655 RepID=A0ABQ7PPF2_PLUXY|nr:hypothetical protein JYU34_022752 [Plutella xylostella]